MAVLTYLVSAFARISASAAVPARARPGLLARFVDRLIAYRSRQALEDMRRHGLRLPHELEQAGWKLNERNEDSLPFVG